MPITDSDAEASGAGGSGAATEVEIVFKLHPKMNEHKELVAPIKDMSTRWVEIQYSHTGWIIYSETWVGLG